MNLPYHFPDPREEAYRRAREFQRLSVAERLAAMLDTIETGMFLLRVSPRREAIDRIFLEREAAWQSLQKELIRRHGQ
ncbi:MAG: hypothetical protein HYS12_17780 [Planctomycetes bacterium]|nr:hypothetical protein [Planctomycetota bacterium]